MKLIIPYTNPDLDGVACSIGYEEYLKTKSIQCKAAIFGNPHSEAIFVLNQINYPKLADAQLLLKNYSELILVDASDKIGIPNTVDPNKVVEVIDHRLHHNKSDFPNAFFQIELVGAAATLIVEKFILDGVQFSQKTGLLLYSAIVSNTINFKANVTTHRDIQACAEIQRRIAIPTNWENNMFKYKSEQISLSSASFLNELTGFFYLNSYKILITQIEILKVENFVQDNREKLIQIFDDIISKHPNHLCMFNFIDINDGYNVFFTLDKKTKSILSNAFNVYFKEHCARFDKIILRKEIIPVLKTLLN